MTFNSDMWISLIQNLANNAESDSCLQHLHIRQLSLNRDEWRNSSTSKPSKLVSVTGCRESMGKWHHDMPQHSAEPIPHTRPWRPRRQSRCISNQCSWRKSLSSAPRPRPGNRDRSRLASSSRALPFKSWSLKSGEHMTYHDIYLRHSPWYKIWKNNPAIHNFIQDISCWQISFKHSIHSHQTQCRNLDPWVLYEEGFGYWAQLNTENKAQRFSKKRHCPFFLKPVFLIFSYLPGEGSLDFYKSATSPPLSSPAARPLHLCLPPAPGTHKCQLKWSNFHRPRNFWRAPRQSGHARTRSLWRAWDQAAHARTRTNDTKNVR